MSVVDNNNCFLKTALQYVDVIPVISTVVNLFVLCSQIFVRFQSDETIKTSNNYKTLDERTIGRTLVVLLLPGLGNIGVALYDHKHHKDKYLPQHHVSNVRSEKQYPSIECDFGEDCIATNIRVSQPMSRGDLVRQLED